MSRFTQFFCKIFVTKKQTPQTFSLLECMVKMFSHGDGCGTAAVKMIFKITTTTWFSQHTRFTLQI